MLPRIDDARPRGCSVHMDQEQRRALRLLADAGPLGVPETLLIEVHRFTEATLAALVRGLVSVVPHSVNAGGTRMTVVRMKITDAGRRAMAS